jgi:hypothetical protein
MGGYYKGEYTRPKKELEMKYLVLKLSKEVNIDKLIEGLKEIKKEFPDVVIWRNLAELMINCD